MLERVEPRNEFDDYGYHVHALADDGTVYGTVYNRQQNRFKAIKSRVGEGTTWLLPHDPGAVEVRTVAASISGVALLFVWAWPQDYIFVPGHGVRQLNNLHPSIFFPNDLNNQHEITGAVDISPNNRGVTYRRSTGFEYFVEERSSGDRINDQGTVLGHLGGGAEGLDIRVWHSDGRISDFVLPTNGPATRVLNNVDEACGQYHREDSMGHVRFGGWFWSDRTGLVEIPFRYIYPEGGFDVQVFGISDDGWVLGREARTDGPEFYREAFLWHVDAGFVDLADLWEWQGRFDPRQVFLGAVNGPGQMAIETFSATLNRWVYVFLDPIK